MLTETPGGCSSNQEDGLCCSGRSRRRTPQERSPFHLLTAATFIRRRKSGSIEDFFWIQFQFPVKKNPG